jgi:membrane-associated phospholipid phosphatase
VIRLWILKENKEFFKLSTFLIGVYLVLILFCLLFIDQSFAAYFGDPARVHIWLFHREITEVGAAEHYILLTLAALLIPRFRKKAGFLLACLLTSGIVVHLFKFILGRARPHKFPDHNAFHFDYFNLHHHFQSLPSGHSQTLFTVVTFLSFLFPKGTWIFLSVAFYFAMTRAFTLAHFVSDVLAGSLVGILITMLTLRFMLRKYGS